MAQLNIHPCTPDEALAIILKVAKMPVDKRPSIMLHGEPGSSKSTIVHTASQILFGKKPVVVHLAGVESTDVKGLQIIDRENDQVRWVQPDFLAKMGAGITFFDEITQARRDVLSASYPIFLDRMVDGHKFHDGAIIIAAGNDCGDGAIANELGTALNDRVLHILVVPSAESFLKYHETRGMHPAVMALIVQMPNLLSCNKQRIDEDLTASPTMRAWERASNILYTMLDDEPTKEINLRMADIATSGIVGIHASGHLILTVRDINECADPKKLLAAPLAQIDSLLPVTVRGGIALAFAFGHICNTAESIVRAAAVMSRFERRRSVVLRETLDGQVPMQGREIATLGVERLLRKAEELKLMDDIMQGEYEGSEALFDYVEKLTDRHEAITAEARSA